jgi:preprotein translocase subunit Sec63
MLVLLVAAASTFQADLTLQRVLEAENPYVILGLTPRVTSEQDINQQYRRVALELHPDKLCARDRLSVDLYECTSKANRAFIIITEAREQLRELGAQLELLQTLDMKKDVDIRPWKSRTARTP